jgi:glucokinase
MITLGLDLGGTTFNAGIIDDAGKVLHSLEFETRQHDSPDVLLPRLAEAVAQVCREFSSTPEDGTVALGIGVPGPVKHLDGICVFAPNLKGWKNLQVSEPLRETLGIPVFLVNYANAAALAEARFGAGRGASSMLMVTLGTGVGSGIIFNKELLIGASERGTELGHITIEMTGPRDGTGNFGTLEALCGRDAIIARAERRLTYGRDSLLWELCPDLSDLSPRHIAEAAAQGDVVAREVWEETAWYLSAGIWNTIMTVDVERVVIGGGVSQAGEVLFAPLRRGIAARGVQMSFDVSQIVPAELGPEAGLIGAAQWARQQVGRESKAR